ncbi:unnamed protein product [Trifolium pratense]|uniref:Uncharacterized protein n=1 Tax=Trifolium pratense TaxID=57577 RepID=A0ACB0KHU2_TRIPR|nr:unnamed protein product [Trifolium pratense]
MGSCCSIQVECNQKIIDGGTRVILNGSSKYVSMYIQKGSKGINQDAMTVWENFNGDEDTIFCGVFDGHGPRGHKFAQSIRDNLPSTLSTTIKMSQQNVSNETDANATNKSTSNDSWEEHFSSSFNQMDEHLAKNVDTDGLCGGCVAITLIKQGDQLIIGNLGDSRAVLCTKEDNNQLIPIQLSVDMVPDVPSESNRVIKCGGRVFAAEQDPDVKRIWMPEGDCPGLAMSRAFGDFCLKDYGLSSVPDLSYRKLTEQDEFIVLASDGIWNVLSNEDVINEVASAPKRSLAAKLLVKRAVKAWKNKYPFYYVDDCSAICLFLNDDQVNV